MQRQFQMSDWQTRIQTWRLEGRQTREWRDVQLWKHHFLSTHVVIPLQNKEQHGVYQSAKALQQKHVTHQPRAATSLQPWPSVADDSLIQRRSDETSDSEFLPLIQQQKIYRPQKITTFRSQLVTNYSRRVGECNIQFHKPQKNTVQFIITRRSENNSILQITVGEISFSGLKKKGCSSFHFPFS